MIKFFCTNQNVLQWYSNQAMIHTKSAFRISFKTQKTAVFNMKSSVPDLSWEK